MKKLTVAATGLQGLLGSRIVEVLGDSYTWIDLSIDRMDITDKASVSNVLSGLDFDILLHLAAYTNVDQAELEPEIAETVNVTGTKNIFDMCNKLQKKMIYISTDFVFDGKEGPYDEDSTPHPLSVYGMTKYHGEKIVEGGAMIVRISYPFGGNVSHKKDLVATLRDLLERKIPIKGVIDQEITPTWIDDIAHSLDYLMHHFSIDTFHIIGSESLNAYGLIQKIGDASNLDTSFVGKTTFKEFYSGKASRPQHARMKSKKNSFHTMHSLTDVLKMK